MLFFWQKIIKSRALIVDLSFCNTGELTVTCNYTIEKY